MFWQYSNTLYKDIVLNHSHPQDDRLPEGMTCTGYDADTGRKYYVDHTSGGSYVGSPYADYGILTPLRSATTARQDNGM